MLSKAYPGAKKPDFVGLSNQGATCYMNSLLQTLFMTPEFRREIYRWRYEQRHGKREECILLQLQLLFTKLQLGETSTAETTALTRSFGWTQSESFQQHDVQEFCRVLFDAIEKSVKDTKQSKIIQELYEGRYVDYVKCLKCGNESTREDKFLDLSLTIKSAFEKIYNDSVEKALHNFVRPEYLLDGNQYFCERCKSKENAIKGLKFKELPYVLVLQLKRFDFDYRTNHRIKINDKVSFQEIMNLNPLINQIETEESEMEIDKEPEKLPFFDNPDLRGKRIMIKVSKKKENIESCGNKEPMALDQISKKNYKEKKFLQKEQCKNEKIEKFLAEGENVFELYSVMVHSGSSFGGHYYAYIKCFDTGKWYNFNDSNVSEISSKDIKKAFGESSSWGNSSSAYLLMYRKIDHERNLIKVSSEDFSVDIMSSFEEHKKKQLDDERMRKEEQKKIIIRVQYNQDIKDISIKNDEKISVLKIASMSAHNIVAGLCNARLREIDFNNSMAAVLNDETPICSAFLHHNKKIGLEIKAEDQEFEDYDPNKMSIKVINWKQYPDYQKSLDDILENPDFIRFPKTGKIKDFIELLSEKYQIPIPQLRIFKRGGYSFKSILENFNFPHLMGDRLVHSGIYESSLMLLESFEDRTKKSKWQEVFEIENAKTLIKFTPPSDFQSSLGVNYQISIHPLKTIAELKSLISTKLNIPESTLILKIASNLSEVKDLSQTIKQGILPNTNLLISRGEPLNPNEIRLFFVLSTPSTQLLKDGEFFKLHPLFDMPSIISWRIPEVKTAFKEKLKEYYPSLSINHCRFREIQMDKLSKWLDDSMAISDITNLDGKRIAVEVLEAQEDVKERNEIIIAARKFNPVSWELEAAVQIKVNSQFVLNQLGEVLSRCFLIKVREI